MKGDSIEFSTFDNNSMRILYHRFWLEEVRTYDESRVKGSGSKSMEDGFAALIVRLEEVSFPF